MANLLLIDNQELQFNAFAKMLRSSEKEFNVFPLEGDYIKVMNYLRISLNHRYLKATRSNAWTLFESYIVQKKIDLFILDHKLIGNHEGENGIDLAVKIRENALFADKHIIFLSRAAQNQPDVKDGLHDKLQDGSYTWVEKGYAGLNILDIDYFKKYVIEKIDQLVQVSDFNSIYLKGSVLVDPDGLYRNNINKIRIIIQDAEKSKQFTLRQKSLIEELYQLKDKLPTEKQIDKIFEKYKYD